MSDHIIKHDSTVLRVKSRFFGKKLLFSSLFTLFFAIYFLLVVSVPVTSLLLFSVTFTFVVLYHLLKNEKVSLDFAASVWFGLMLIAISGTIFRNGGVLVPGYFWFPILAFSGFKFLSKKKAKFWGMLCVGLIFLFFALNQSGHIPVNPEWEEKRAITHLINAICFLLYLSMINVLSNQIRDSVEGLNHKLFGDLYTENRLNNMAQIVGGISHELNNPLSISTGNLNRLNRHLRKHYSNEDPKLDELIAITKDANSRMAGIVKQLKQFNKKELSKVSLIDIREEIENTLRFMKSSFFQEKVGLSTALGEKALFVCVDQSRLQQVLLNIIKNAIEAMQESQEKDFFVSLEEESGNVYLLFKDTGHGILSRNPEKVFEPFFTTKAVGSGTGLGLSISRNIIQCFGGSLKMRNNASSGVTVELKLPLSDEIKKRKELA